MVRNRLASGSSGMAAPVNQGSLPWPAMPSELALIRRLVLNRLRNRDNHAAYRLAAAGRNVMTQIAKPVSYSQTWTFFEGKWHEGNAPIMGPRTHAAWLGSTVFDGARAFEGVAPDLDRHCARVNWSAANFRLEAGGRYRDLDRARARRHRAFCAGCRALRPPDVLGAAWPRRRRAVRPRDHQLVPVHLRGADAAADGERDHAVAVPSPDRGMRAGRCQGGLSLSRTIRVR